jgi:aminoglycoside 2'-N-acetyltransferase I
VSAVRVATTGDVPAAVLVSARELMVEAFPEGFTDHDWEHALGGLHAWVEDPVRVVVAHGALVRRRWWGGEEEVGAGYVEAVAVRPDRRREGLGAAVMTALEDRAPAYDLLVLGSSDEGLPFYASRGWVPWRGPTGVRHPGRDVATPEEDGAVLVLPLTRRWRELDLEAPLRCEPRAGDDW